MESGRTKKKGKEALVPVQMVKLEHVSVRVQETGVEKRRLCWLPAQGGRFWTLQLFWVLILLLTSVLTSIAVSFDSL